MGDCSTATSTQSPNVSRTRPEFLELPRAACRFAWIVVAGYRIVAFDTPPVGLHLSDLGLRLEQQQPHHVRSGQRIAADLGSMYPFGHPALAVRKPPSPADRSRAEARNAAGPATPSPDDRTNTSIPAYPKVHTSGDVWRCLEYCCFAHYWTADFPDYFGR